MKNTHIRFVGKVKELLNYLAFISLLRDEKTCLVKNINYHYSPSVFSHNSAITGGIKR